jgi:ubiquitin-protein ligase E3 D
VFTPDLHFSSSVDEDRRNDPTRALKVFWKKAPKDLMQGDLLTAQNLSIEDIALPSELFESLETALAESPRLLPASARNFQDWNVALLERFPQDLTT